MNWWRKSWLKLIIIKIYVTSESKMIQNFEADIFRCIFVNENGCISIIIPLKFVHRGQINNIPALVQIGRVPLEITCVINSINSTVLRNTWSMLKLWHDEPSPGCDEENVFRENDPHTHTRDRHRKITLKVPYFFGYKVSHLIVQSEGWNYLSIPKRQRCSRWSLWMDK